MEFSGKTVLITGAAVGIGRACALQFAKAQANIVLVDLNEETLTETKNEIEKIKELDRGKSPFNDYDDPETAEEFNSEVISDSKFNFSLF